MKASLPRVSPLKVERERRGWSQIKLAETLGVSTTTVRRWERGQAVPYPYYREKLVDLFGKSAQQLGLLPPVDEPGDALPPAPCSEMATSPTEESTIRLLTHDVQLSPNKHRIWPQAFWKVDHPVRAEPTPRLGHRFVWLRLSLVSPGLVALVLISIVAFPFTQQPLPWIRSQNKIPTIQPQNDITYGPPSYAMIIQNADSSLQDIDQHLQQVFTVAYGQLVNRFALDPAKAPQLVVITDQASDFSSLASPGGTIITLSSHWVKQHPNDGGLLIHELTLQLEHYPSAVPGWFADGLADYARSVYGPANDDWSLPDSVQSQERYTQGGGVTARFLRWLELHTRLDIVDQLHHALQKGQPFSAAFHNLTHVTIDQLWSQYQTNPDITPTPQQRYIMVTSRKPLYRSSYQQLKVPDYKHTIGATLSNFAIQADVTILSYQNAGAGFFFRDDGVNWGYIFLFAYGTYRLDSGFQSVNHQGPEIFSSAIKTGLKQTNQLTAIVEKSSIFLYINGQFVTQVDNPHLLSNGLQGVIVTSLPAIPQAARFDHIQVW